MKKAIILYHSKNGTTKQFSSELAELLSGKNVESTVAPVEHFDEMDLSCFDLIFLGCWTKGLLFFAQHPDSIWQEFVKSLSFPSNAKIALFTTYKTLTGSMFSKMTECIPENHRDNVLQIKSRDCFIPAKMITQIENFAL